MPVPNAFNIGYLCGYAGSAVDPYLMGFGAAYMRKTAAAISSTQQQVDGMIQGLNTKMQDPQNQQRKVKKVKVEMEMDGEPQIAGDPNAQAAAQTQDAAAPVPPDQVMPVPGAMPPQPAVAPVK